MDYAAVQGALKARGYPLGNSGPRLDGVDGEPGRMTIAAVRRFQLDQGPPFTGTGLIGPMTLKALGLASDAKPAEIEPPWLAIARGKIGLHEVRDNAALRAFLKSDGVTLGNPAVLPWCGDFVESCIAIALPEEPIRPTTHGNPYWAKNWMGFGLELAEPSPGAVLVFGRNGGGHVAFYLGEDGPAFIVLGGNQGNAVSVMKIEKARLEPNGIRWPATFARPTRGPVKLSLKAALSTNEA